MRKKSKWYDKTAVRLVNNPKELQSVLKEGKHKAKSSTSRRRRYSKKQRLAVERADRYLQMENRGITDSWLD